MTRYRIRHVTTYVYQSPMTDGYSVAHLLPRSTPWQRVESAGVRVDPAPAERDEFDDVFGNHITQFGVHQPHDGLVVEAESVVEVTTPNAVDDVTPWDEVRGRLPALRGEDAITLGAMRATSRFVPLDELGAQLHAYAAPSFLPGRGIVDAARDLCRRINADFVFDPTSTEWSTPLAEVLGMRRGVCQDFAHLAAGCLRSVGLAARYVSGYIETEPPEGVERLVGADASHAWCSLWTPVAGWVDFDPTNDHLPTHRHVTVAWGRDYADVTPIRGVVLGPATDQRLEVSVDVAALPDAPL
jgi:transglutaminase-like putative cysteine protease